ncbi:DNA-binding transcriptional regulator, MerR family [Thermoactinomyces sp. DSM 45891]|uniref:MerR family transcriptional regulator n=1 Tax=Thermoactinomyces sp. DSM 45891 TaxID=1761907 RepID=UPI000917664D|nr:MerR family transcriptional regulator [Thermoactinomyces sp. DSM 45891]SFX64225.1 DNA-binding transcriptional regulator, MerR family [Thermoactinomyces sp. DSM 45891]
MKVKEVADLVGVSVRTLHHYDEIGLLIPDETTESGYRLYSNENLELLQQILFFKELGFSLQTIKEIVYSPTFDRQEALQMHHQTLVEKRNRLDKLIQTVEKTIQHNKGEIQMMTEERFEGFDFRSNPYEQEARERWGDEAVNRSNQKVAQMGPEIQKEMNDLYLHLASIRHVSPDSEKAQSAIAKWYDMLQSFGDYTPEAFRSLGEMYVSDQRFTKSIDRFGEGLAMFMRDAMGVYADRHQK